MVVTFSKSATTKILMTEQDDILADPATPCLKPGDIPRADDVWPDHPPKSRQDGRILLLMLLFINLLLLGFLGFSGSQDLGTALRVGIEVFEVGAVLVVIKLLLFPGKAA